MSKTYYSTFNPHEVDEETLERLFVAREDLASDVMEGIRESATSNNKHQRLLIGPRGIGKTNFVTLIYRRVRRDRALDSRLHVAWLNEDLRIHNYAGLLLAIAEKLGKEYDDERLAQAIEEVLDLGNSGLQEAVLERKILDFLAGKTLLLIAENLDDLLTVLKESGQRKLRSLIETRRNVTILATSTSLVDFVMERKKTFFGFFRIATLQPLEVEEATQLIALLAEEDDDPELAQVIRSPLGFARIRAVHYLAGGNPRVYVLLYDFLSRESLDDLTQPFMRLIDGLTPYYQARMDRLAPLQRTIVDVLSRHREPLAVAKIARQAMSSPQSVSSQLAKLRNLGYVTRAASIGREIYYELREPLMRFCLQVKEQQGRTIELFVQFLRVWYSEPELDRLATSTTGMEQEAARYAMLEQDPLLPSLAADFASHQVAGNHELSGEPANAADWGLWAGDLAMVRRMDEAWIAFRRSLEEDPHSVSTWGHLWFWLQEQGRLRLFHDMVACVAQLLPENARLFSWLGIAQSDLGHFEEARASFEKALAMDPELDSKGEPTAFGFATALSYLGRHEEALAALDDYQSDSARMEFRLALAHASIQLELGRHEKGEAELNELLGTYRPPLWTGEDLIAASKPLLTSSDPAVWRPAIRVWLACCTRHQCLNELGQGLVRSLRRLAIPRISDETARAWHETWRELATGVEELELPLKLFRAGVEFRAGAGRKALLGLAQEERGLLEPWLGNLFPEESDEHDREMRHLLRTVEARIAELIEKERSRAFWSSPRPELEPAVFKRLLATRRARKAVRLAPLLPGSLEPLPAHEVEALLRLSAEQDDLAARAWSRPGLEVLGASMRSLAFSDWSLYQVHFREEGKAGAIDLLGSEDRAVVLDGRSQILFDLFSAGTIKLDTDEARREYTRFFCSMLRGTGGRFRIIDAPEDIPFADLSDVPEDLELEPWATAPTPTVEDGFLYTGAVLYGDALFKATFQLSSLTRGNVEMVDDSPIAQDLEIWREQFDGPLRLLPTWSQSGARSN